LFVSIEKSYYIKSWWWY